MRNEKPVVALYSQRRNTEGLSYREIADTFNSSRHQRLNLTLTYIFNYGKKVKQGNELQVATGGQSSIL